MSSKLGHTSSPAFVASDSYVFRIKLGVNTVHSPGSWAFQLGLNYFISFAGSLVCRQQMERLLGLHNCLRELPWHTNTQAHTNTHTLCIHTNNKCHIHARMYTHTSYWFCVSKQPLQIENIINSIYSLCHKYNWEITIVS